MPEQKRRLEVRDLGYASKRGLKNAFERLARRGARSSLATSDLKWQNQSYGR